MPLFVVHYLYSAATAADRDRVRPEHRGWLAERVDDGAVLSSGPTGDGSGAFIIVSADTLDDARALMADDPFSRADLVESAEFTEWKPVLGAFVD